MTQLEHITLEELCCSAILAFFAMHGAIPFIAPNQALELTSLPATGLMFYGGVGSQILVYGAIACLLLRHMSRIAHWLCAMQWTLALAALAVASTIWSQFPLYTIRRSLPFALAGFFGLYLAARFPVRRQLRILRMTMFALALGTLVMVLAFPKIGLDMSAGHHANWQGVFTQKNACGRMMVLATAVLLADWKPTWQRTTGCTLFLIVLIMSGSRSAWGVELVVLVLWVALRLAKHTDAPSRIIAALVFFCALPAFAAVVYIWHGPLLALLGRDATLSGRTLIWRQVWIFIVQRPWLGWGYEAFWRGARGEAFRVIAAVHFMVFHAHNGFLEIWLDLGLAGLVLFLLSYARAWRRLWPAIRAGEIDRVLWPALVLTLVLLYDLDENTLLTYNGLFWVLYVATVANIEFLAAEGRLRQEAAEFDERSGYVARPAVSF